MRVGGVDAQVLPASDGHQPLMFPASVCVSHRIAVLSARRTGQVPVKSGSRFSAKARGPSLASLLPKIGPAQLQLVGQGLGLGEVGALAQAPQDGLDGERAVGGDLIGQLPGLGERLPVGHDVADEADLLGLRRRHLAARQQQLGRDRVGDLPSEADGAAAQREEAPAHLGHPEDGALPRDPQVHGLQDLGAAGHGVPLDRRDEGLARLEVPQQRAPVQIGVGVEPGRPLVIGVTSRHGLEVSAGAEVSAGSGDDRGADLRVLVDLHPGVVHPHEHLPGQRVAGLRTVERHGRDVAVALEDDVGVAHG